MRRLLPFLILLAAVYAKATTTLTINVTSLTGGTSPGNSVRIDLQNCAGARVIGTGQIVAQSQTVFPIGGVVTVTLYDNQQIDCGGGRAVSYYSFNYIYQGVIVSIGSYNLPPGTFLLSNLNPCVGDACIGGGSTIVNRIIAGTNITISPTTGLGQVTINSTASGTGNPATPFFSCQFNNSGVFGGGPGCTLDILGNIKTKSYDGLNNAFGNQTTPTSNDGIQRSLQAIGNYVVAGNDYACTEGSYSSLTGYRLGIGVPAPFANATWLQDRRGTCGLLGDYAYNTFFGPSGGTWRYDRWIQNQLPQRTGNGVTQIPFREDFELSGSGKNGFEGGGPDSLIPHQWDFELMTRGIITPFNVNQQAYSMGDNHIWQNSITNNRGSNDASGEGFNTVRNQITQNLTPMVTTANSTLAAGATLIQGTLLSNVPFVGDGTPYIDATKGSAVFRILSTTLPGGAIAGTWTLDTAFTPDNIGRTSVTVNTPKQYYGATTNETVTLTGLTHAICAGNTSWSGSACVVASVPATACYADPSYQESAQVISVGTYSSGTQVVTMALRYVHQPSAYVAQGPNACNFAESRANQTPGSFPGRQLFRVIGFSDANTLLYARTVFGNFHEAPQGFYVPYAVAPAGVTLTRTANVTSVVLVDPSRVRDGVAVFVAGCADTSFNGGFNPIVANGTTATWSNTGANGTTTCTDSIEIDSRLSGLRVREGQMFPGAEIVNTVDPTTHANNFNISVEPNSNFQVSAGDQLEDNVYSDVVMGFGHDLMEFQSQSSASAPSIMRTTLVSGEIPSGTQFERITFLDSPLHYQGLGGTKPILSTMYDFGGSTMPFLNIFEGLPPPRQHLFSVSGCLYGCADSRSQFDFIIIPTNNGFYGQTVYQDLGKMITTASSTSLGSVLTRDESPIGMALVANNGTNSNIYSFIPSQTQNTVHGGGGTLSTTTQTPTSWSSTVPITVPSCIGCGPLTSSATTTAAVTDVVTITGMTSSGHCAAPAPTNAAAGTMIQNASPVFIDTFTTNAITLHHVATAGATFSFICTPN